MSFKIFPDHLIIPNNHIYPVKKQQLKHSKKNVYTDKEYKSRSLPNAKSRICLATWMCRAIHVLVITREYTDYITYIV